MSKEQTDLKTIIQKHADNYLQNIKEEKMYYSSHELWYDDFPLFQLMPLDSQVQYYFGTVLEHYTRWFIVGTLYELFENENNYIIDWPELDYLTDINKSLKNGRDNKHYFKNSEVENEYLYELIIEGPNNKDEDKKIAIRFVDYDENLIENYNPNDAIDEIWNLCLVDFDPYGDYENYYCVLETLDNNKTKILDKSIKDIFDEYFSECDFQIFKDSLISTIDQANAIVGIKSVPNLSAEYLSNFRFILKTRLRVDLFHDFKNYIVIFKDNKPEITSSLEEDSKQLVEKYSLINKVLNNRLIEVLVGDSTIAKCYETAEYLFINFDKNSRFDYTSIVSGYLKAVEQLLKTVVSYFKTNNNEEDDSEGMQMFGLIDYLKNYPKKHKKSKIRFVFNVGCAKEAKIITNCLDCYRDECRNKLFHSDMLTEWKNVEIIRQDTVIIIIMLLGLINIPENKLKEQCGFKDDKYEEFIYNVFGSSFSTLLLKDKNNIIHKLKLLNKQNIVFDDAGFVKTGDVVFKEYGSDYNNFNPKTNKHSPDYLIVSKNTVEDFIFEG